MFKDADTPNIVSHFLDKKNILVNRELLSKYKKDFVNLKKKNQEFTSVVIHVSFASFVNCLHLASYNLPQPVVCVCGLM